MDHEKYLFMRMLYNIFFNYIHIFYIYNIWHVSSDQCEDKFSRLFLLTLSVKANRMSNLIVCVLGWSTDWGADRWVQGGILPLRQGWRRHHHHQGVGNCKFQQHSLNNFLQPISSSKGSPSKANCWIFIADMTGFDKRQYKKYKYNNVKFSTFRTVITLYLSIANTEATDQLQLFVTLSQVLTTLSLQLSPVVCCYISSIVFPCYRETLLLHTSWRQTPADIHNNFSPATAQPSPALLCVSSSRWLCARLAAVMSWNSASAGRGL